MSRIANLTLASALLAGAWHASGVDVRPLGAIQGSVRNAAGRPQIGAEVMLEGRGARILARARTSFDGRFKFDALIPDTYTIRVLAASFVPADKQNVQVRAGMASVLSVQLASFFSSIELVSILPETASLVSDQWKWVLRSDSGLRPVLRYSESSVPLLPGISSSDPAPPIPTSGMVRLFGGDSPDLGGNSSDMGTGFALATSVFGTREFQLSGNVGFAAATGAPATAFRTRYSSLTGNTRAPDFEFTVRQLGLRQRIGDALLSGTSGVQPLPALRSYSFKLEDQQHIGERMKLNYGLLMETVDFIDHVNVLSPYAKLNYDFGSKGAAELAFSSGAPGQDLLPPSTPSSDALNGLNQFPRVSLLGGQAQIQRSAAYEAGYHLALGDTSLKISGYQENIKNQAFAIAGNTSALSAGDLLPDLTSNSSIFNFGNFTSTGYLVSAARPLADKWSASLYFGEGGALKTNGSEELAVDADALRSRMRIAQTKFASAKINGVLPHSGTIFSMAYIWTPGGQLIPTHAFITQDWQPGLGLNIQVRQPLPAFSGMAGRFEMTAEVRNLLAQGYLPVPSSDGQNMLLVPFPRSLRGGLSFIF
jgi:hypothetical protein